MIQISELVLVGAGSFIYGVMACGWWIERRNKPKLYPHLATFNGYNLCIMAAKYTDDGTWQRWIDDRGALLVAVPSKDKAPPPDSSPTKEK